MVADARIGAHAPLRTASISAPVSRQIGHIPLAKEILVAVHGVGGVLGQLPALRLIHLDDAIVLAAEGA